MTYILHLIIVFDIFIVLSISLNFLTGYLGLFSLSHAVFYGIGAYTTGLSMIKLNLPIPIAFIFSMVLGGFLGFIISKIIKKARKDDFILISLAVQMIGYSLLMNWTALTNGPFGISNIPRILIGSLPLSNCWLALLFTFLSIGATFFAIVIQKSPFGRTLEAIRDDELAASSLGIDCNMFIQKTMIISGMMSALAGGLYAIYATYIDPTSFSVNESMLFILVLIIGGAGNTKGPIIGAFIITLLPEILRSFNLPIISVAEFRQILFGIAIVVFMRLRPHGIGGTYNFK